MIGYCTAKKRAFVGYKATIVNAAESMLILEYRVTPANRHDASALVPVLLSMERHGTITKVGDFYGDNAFFTVNNMKWLSFYEKACKFHSKEETGKNPKKRRSAKKKSHIRSRIESTFGILHKNHHFGRARTRELPKVTMDACLIFTSWNLFFMVSYFMDKSQHRISLRKLFYEN